MPALTIPNSFSANTTAHASEVNSNFTAVATLLNSTKLDNTNIQTGGLSTANLADDAVTKTKLASDVVDGVTLEQLAGGELAVKDTSITLAKLASAVVSALVPTGTIFGYGGTSAPTGFLLCDGSAVSRSTYSALYAVIGDANGHGDGVTTFNIPDGRGQFLRGVDGSRGLDPDASTRTAAATGGNAGNNIGSAQTDQFKSHAHPAGNESTFTGAAGHSAFNLSAPINTRDSATGAFGGNETRPTNIYVNYLIKT